MIHYYYYFFQLGGKSNIPVPLGELRKKKFLPSVSHFVLGFHTSAVDRALINRIGFSRLPQNKDSLGGREREGHAWGGRGGHACLL